MTTKPGICTVLSTGNHIAHCRAVEGSSCFYYPELDISAISVAACADGQQFVARAGRIEVSDNLNARLHQHPGATIAIITAGSGFFLTKNGKQKVFAGDVVYVPANTPHLSVADRDTTMIEWIVYLGAENDVQTLIETE